MWFVVKGWLPSDHPAVLNQALHADNTRVDQLIEAAPLSMSSPSATSLSALAPAQRAGAQRLRAVTLNGPTRAV
jgi:hypothetical protein